MTHVDFVIVRRDEVISADVPITLVGEAIEVHHGDGLVEQQMFTLPINALPTAIPSSIEADISGLTIGGQVRVSDLVCPSGVTTDIDPETAIAIGQPPRVVRRRKQPAEGEAEEGEGPRACPGDRGGDRDLGRRGLGPAPPLRPVRAPGHAGGPAGGRAGQPRRRVRRAACTTQGPMRSSCWRSNTAHLCGPRRAPTARAAVVDAGRRTGWPWPSRPPT